ncbi:MAG: hypothetical protein U1F36_11320 [Planctomycetota bacterium]
MRQFLFALALACVTPLRAQDAELIRIVATLDADKNGTIERSEFPGSDEQFAAIDTDKDRKLSKAELAKSDLVRRLLGTMRSDDAPPRAREDQGALALRRLENLARFDPNHDGRVQKDEWRGSATAFAELDLDGDGVLSPRDLELARRRVSAPIAATGLPEFKSNLEAPAELLRRLDRDRDGAIQRREVGDHRLAPAFDWADRNRDGALDERELQRLVGEVARQVERRNRGSGRIQAYRVPFATWDSDKDGRIAVAEWKGPAYLFARIDSDRDAALLPAEIERYVRSVEGSTFLERFDLDDDGKVTAAEFGGPIDAMRRFDRNRDGVVSGADR